MSTIDNACKAAANLIEQSDALLITAMQVRAWASTPVCRTFAATKAFGKPIRRLANARLEFRGDRANPAHFTSKPELGWGFYEAPIRAIPRNRARARRFLAAADHCSEAGTWCIRFHQQRRRPFPKGWFRGRAGCRMPRLDSSLAMHARLWRTYLGSG